jgi:hypothetical protein
MSEQAMMMILFFNSVLRLAFLFNRNEKVETRVKPVWWQEQQVKMLPTTTTTIR